MEEDNEPIICFQHCTNVNILCLRLPDTCPLCSEFLSGCMKIPPFRIPTPFTHSKEKPHSIVIKPSSGSFFESTESILNEDLHVGICDSKGVVYDFDEDGMNKSSDGWPQCIAVKVVEKKDFQILSLWNSTLQEFSETAKWNAENYDEDTNNCFTFALEFLRVLQPSICSDSLKDKVTFCENLLLPYTKSAAKYLHIYEKLSLEGGIIVEKSEIDTHL